MKLNMTSFYEIIRHKKIERANYCFLALYIAISVTCHCIANRLVLVAGFPLFSSALLYMAVFVLSDVFATYNTRSQVVVFIFLDALANLFFMLFTNFVNTLSYPDFFNNAEAYKAVFSPVVALYFASLLGTIIASLLDLYLFSYLYKKVHLNFLISTIISSVLTISCYTLVTDIIAFKQSFPEHYIDLTLINICSNLITLIAYAIIGQFVVFGIRKYITN